MCFAFIFILVIDLSAGRYGVILSELTLVEECKMADIGGIDRLHPGSSFVKSAGVRSERRDG